MYVYVCIYRKCAGSRSVSQYTVNNVLTSSRTTTRALARVNRTYDGARGALYNFQAQRFALERQKVRTQSTWRGQPEQRPRQGRPLGQIRLESHGHP